VIVIIHRSILFWLVDRYSLLYRGSDCFVCIPTFVADALDGVIVADGQGMKKLQAQVLLTKALANGPATATDIFKLMASNGIGQDTMKRAKRAMGIKSKRNGFGGEWLWIMGKREIINHNQTGADLKETLARMNTLCVELSNAYGKTNKVATRTRRIVADLERLRSALEEQATRDCRDTWDVGWYYGKQKA
jgi:hypothetical protein